MDTYFAPAERADEFTLLQEIELASENPVTDGLMNAIGGLVAILNEHRQIIALNETLLKTLGVGEASEVLGLRPGEAVGCVHAHELPGGCGTSEFCATCGAAIAIVTSLAKNKSAEQTCALSVKREGQVEDIYLRVRASPITFKGKRLLLLFLQDITQQQQWAKLEQTFYHDISNLITALAGTSELLTYEDWNDKKDLNQTVFQLSQRLLKEVEFQKALAQTELTNYQPILTKISVAQIIAELQNVYGNHPVAKGKYLDLPAEIPNLSFTTDFYVMMHVLDNMLKNAFEATPEGDRVKLWIETNQHKITFLVQNPQPIPADVAKRIFQRNFSTKEGIGRGLGTYSMKLFGERFLGGTVDFSTSSQETTFWFKLSI
jgi:signal transduction histidine kinase